MTGHQALLSLRRAGMKPACVWVLDDDAPTSIKAAQTWHAEPNPFAHKLFAQIHLSDTDTPESLDLRCLMGLRIHMTCARGTARAKRLFAALIAAKPAFLIAEHDGEVWTHGGLNG